MARPTTLFDIATNANFTTGDRVGSPTKLPIADVPNGLVPGTPATPEQINFALDQVSLWLHWLRDNFGLTEAFRFFQPLLTGAGIPEAAGPTNLPPLIAGLVAVVARSDISTYTQIRGTTTPGLLTAPPRVSEYIVNPDDDNYSWLLAINAEYVGTGGAEWTRYKTGQNSILLRLLRTGRFECWYRFGTDADTWPDTYAQTSGGWNRLIFEFAGQGNTTKIGAALLQILNGGLQVDVDAHVIGNTLLDGDLATGGDSITGGQHQVLGLSLPHGGFDSVDVVRSWLAVANAGVSFTAGRGERCTVNRNTATDEITFTFGATAPSIEYSVNLSIQQSTSSTFAPAFFVQTNRSTTDYTFKIVDAAGVPWDLDAAGTIFRLSFELRY